MKTKALKKERERFPNERTRNYLAWIKSEGTKESEEMNWREQYRRKFGIKDKAAKYI